MNDPKQNINDLMQRAASDLKIPTEVAQMFLLVAAELLDLRAKADWLEQEHLRHSELLRRQSRQLEQLRGVHGA